MRVSGLDDKPYRIKKRLAKMSETFMEEATSAIIEIQELIKYYTVELNDASKGKTDYDKGRAESYEDHIHELALILRSLKGLEK